MRTLTSSLRKGLKHSLYEHENCPTEIAAWFARIAPAAASRGAGAMPPPAGI